MVIETTTQVLLLQWLFVSALFLISILIQRNDIADIAWGPGIAFASWSGWFVVGQPTDLLTLVVLGAVSVWALRIGVRILLKNIGKPEDPRYKRWRDSWGVWFYPRSYVQVFLLQGALMIIMSLVVLAANLASDYSTLLIVLGSAVWIIGFLFETIADYQLDRFTKNKDNRGTLMRYGLWRYSRHPNYFGEITMWWGLFIMVLSTPLWFLGLLPALTITGLILFVSGIPLLEQQMEKYDEWDEYKRRTSVLIPLPSKA